MNEDNTAEITANVTDTVLMMLVAPFVHRVMQQSSLAPALPVF